MEILCKCFLLLLASIQADVAINAQQPCRPPAPQLSREPNIFTEEQEVKLGETVAEHMRQGP
jgi:hypothetical protein